MKKLYLLMAVLYACLCQLTFAQSPDETYHRRSGGHGDNTSSSTGNSGTGSNINVVYHRCDWNINPVSGKNINGTVTTYFRTIAANVSSLTFDLNKTSFNNGSLVVKYHGTTCTTSFPASGYTDILTITLPSTIATSGTLDSVSITYSGTPPAVSGQAEGFQRGEVTAGSGNWYIYTLSESYEDKDWWPCKADMQDKIDSMDINVTVPNNYWVATAGKLIDSTINGANRTFKFKHRYPIASYLVALGVARYTAYHRGTVNISGKQVPVVYYTYSTPSAATLNTMDLSKTMLTEFSNKYGPYPFADEKHGYYQFAWGGGMEHQTFSAMSMGSMGSWSVVAHELGHQWFGDKVSFATWSHLWLAEGFAKYSEVLAAETIPAIGVTPASHLSGIKSTARSTSTTPVKLSAASIASSNTIWTTANDNAVYQRGAMIVSMLRAMMGDAKFFAGLKAYQSDPLLAYKSATSADLQRNLENQMPGVNLTPFFTAWVDGSGTPSYTVNRYISGNTIQFTLSQTRSPVATPFMPMPVVLNIANAAGTQDTTVVIYHHSATQLGWAGLNEGMGNAGANFVSYRLSFTPATITFDPGNVTMATGTINTSATPLATNINDFRATQLQLGNQLNLSVGSNENISKVVLLRSENGVDFTEVGNMIQSGQNNQVYSFRYTDNNISAPVIYYRAQIFTANRSDYSSVVKVQRTGVKATMQVSPSPANDVITVSFTNPSRQKATVRIVGIDGKSVMEAGTANEFIHYDVSTLPAGMYIAQVLLEGQESQSYKFYISH